MKSNSTEEILSGNILYENLIALHENYLHDKRKILSTDPDPEKHETKFIWFELNDSFRAFLREVLNDTDVNGIKTYIIQYPKTQQDMKGELIPKNKDDVNKLSVGFVTTKGDNRVDYPESGNGSGDKNKILVFAPPMDHGELCPRLCP